MKKWIVLFTLLILLTGCARQGEFETVGDVYAPVSLTAKEVTLALPSEAAVQTLSGEGGKLYLCDGYTVSVQTLPGGDLAKSLRQVTGYSIDRLTVLETEKDGFCVYRCVWTAAGEGGDQIAQTALWDDGNFHYAITAMADSAHSGKLAATWQEIFRSVELRGKN